MRIIVYSETTAATVGGNLGRPEYSYYFILNKYLPVLSRLGEVIHVEDPLLEVDTLFDEAAAAGEPSVFLSFTPPHRTASGLRCPTVCVLAWEFDNIPSDDWDADEPWQNWVMAIREIGHVLTISDYATRVIKRQVGRGPRVETVPAPVDSVIGVAAEGRDGLPGNVARARHRTLALKATIFDTQALDIDSESVTPRAVGADGAGAGGHLWDGHAVEWGFSNRSATSGQYLVGFYGEEDWGSWSKTARPSVIFPWSIVGEVELSIELVGYGANQGRTVSIHVGARVVEIVLPATLQVFQLAVTLDKPVNNLYFTGLTAVPRARCAGSENTGAGA